AIAAARAKCPASGPAPPGRAESRKKVLQIAEIHFSFGLVLAAAGAFGVSPIIRARPPLGAALVDFAAVVARPLVRVADQVIGGRNRLEPCFGFGFPGVQVGMKLLGELAIGF